MIDPPERQYTEPMVPAAKVHRCTRKIFWLAVSFSILFGVLAVITLVLYWALPGAPSESLVLSLVFVAGASPSSALAYAVHRMCAPDRFFA